MDFSPRGNLEPCGQAVQQFGLGKPNKSSSNKVFFIFYTIMSLNGSKIMSLRSATA